jgi:hypothetical protein
LTFITVDKALEAFPSLGTWILMTSLFDGCKKRNQCSVISEASHAIEVKRRLIVCLLEEVLRNLYHQKKKSFLKQTGFGVEAEV